MFLRKSAGIRLASHSSFSAIFPTTWIAASRAINAGHPGHNDGLAWQAGLAINQIKKKGDWTLGAYYQYSGAYSLDPNLVDNDIFDSHQNMQGVVAPRGICLHGCRNPDLAV